MYLRRDLSKRLQRWLRHLERLQLSRGHHLGGWSQVWRQMRGHWLDSAHGLRGQDLWQGRWLGHWKRLVEEKGVLCSDTKEIHNDPPLHIHTRSYAHTHSSAYTLPHTHSDSHTQPHHLHIYIFITLQLHIFTHNTHIHTVNYLHNIHPHTSHTNTQRPPSPC